MPNIDQVQLPDGSQYNLKDDISGYVTAGYVDDAIDALTKADVGLGNVDNTSDLNKPVSTAQQTALNGKTDTTVIAPTEATTTASRRYEIGEQFILNGVLYTATAVIASGDSIIVNTNCDLSESITGQIKEVDAKTQHGIVELWKNSNMGSDFAGQTININSFDSTKYDAIVIVLSRYKGEIGSNVWNEFDLESFGQNAELESLVMAKGADTFYFASRAVTITLSGTTLSVTFADCGVYGNTSGNISGAIGNDWNIPVRILGLIHNS